VKRKKKGAAQEASHTPGGEAVRHQEVLMLGHEARKAGIQFLMGGQGAVAVDGVGFATCE
jgi:hypothetical protein